MYCILTDKSDLYLTMGKVRQLPLKKMSSTGTKVTERALRDNTVGNNGSQLTGGGLTSVVMETIRRVANLPRRHITGFAKKGRIRPLISHGFRLYPINRKVEFDAPSNTAYGLSP